MRELVPMTLADLETAPFVVSSTTILPAPPDAVFAELNDASAWYPLMKSSTWHGRVGGVGAEREVWLRVFGGMREEMLAWDVGRRVAFTMTHSTSPLVTRMGEDYVLRPVTGGTELSWRMVGHLTKAGRATRPLLRALLNRMNATAAKRLGRCATASGKARGTHAS